MVGIHKGLTFGNRKRPEATCRELNNLSCL